MTRTFETADIYVQGAARALFRGEAQKDSQSILLHLVTVDIPEGTDPVTCPAVTLHLVDANYNVTYTDATTGVPITYAAFPMQISSGVSMSSDGSVDTVSLVVANPERIFMGYINRYRGLRGATVMVKTLYQKHLDFIYLGSDGSLLDTPLDNPDKNQNAYLQDYYVVDAYSATDTTITFTLLPSIDLNVKLPKGRFQSSTCRFKYKDPQTCGYPLDGPLPSCKKDLADCKAHLKVVADAGRVTILPGADVAVLGYPLIVEPGQFLEVNSHRYEISSVINGTTLTNPAPGTTPNGAKILYKTLVLRGTMVKLTAVCPSGESGNGTILQSNGERFGGFPGVPSTTRYLVF